MPRPRLRRLWTWSVHGCVGCASSGASLSPKPRTHDGFEWLYVLSGQMRLVMGDQDIVLGIGEAAEFDTQVPHWFGSTGEGPAEVLSIFGRPGERMHTHAQAGTLESVH